MKKYIRWLYDELPKLTEAGVLSAETAEKIRGHYGEAGETSRRSVALTVCSILGALLIGFGIILLLAYNWEDLSRPVRAIISVIPLLIAQALGFMVLWKEKQSSAWREGVGIFLVVSIGAAISLVGQTYHVPGDFGRFLLAWMIPALPVAYILRSSGALVLYLSGITAWLIDRRMEDMELFWFWGLYAAAMPYLLMEMRKAKFSVQSVVMGWIAAIVACIAVGVSLDHSRWDMWTTIYPALFGVFYLVDGLWLDEGQSAARRPLHTIGALGIAVLSLIFTFDHTWHFSRIHEIFAGPWFDLVCGFGLSAVVLVLLIVAQMKGRRSLLVFGLFPMIALVVFLQPLVIMIAFNVYSMVLGIRTIMTGIKFGRIGTTNAGMAIIVALIFMRFFDADMGLLAKGVSFILVGMAFLTANVVMLRKMRRKV